MSGEQIKPTPGPWDMFVGNANGRGLIRIEAGNDSPDAGRHIASLTRGKENEANATLMSYSPRMYEMLQEINRVHPSNVVLNLLSEIEASLRNVGLR